MNLIKDLEIQLEEKCRFCNPPERERILYETEHFYVMVSLGPIVEGYLLIVTKNHIGACLNIPITYLTEFLELKEKVRSILLQAYGCCLFYEHGKLGTSLKMTDGHKHCYHAHLHCIPTKIKLTNLIDKEFEGERFEDFRSFHDLLNGVQKYLYIEDDKLIIYQPKIKIRKQYLRYMLANSLGTTERWDWVNNQNWELINRTTEKLKKYFNELS